MLPCTRRKVVSSLAIVMNIGFNVEVQLTDIQVDLLVDALELLPETMETKHLMEYLTYRKAAVNQEHLLQINSCVNMEGTALSRGGTFVVQEFE